VRRLAAAAALITVGTTTPAGADSITPVQFTITIAPVARLHRPLSITVGVSADPSVLDTRTAPLRIRVKLADECGGEFPDTPGTILLDEQLKPQPAYGVAYSATARGAGRPGSYGVKSVCVYLEEEGDNRQFATDTSYQVDVSKPCTVAAAHYDKAVRALERARRRGRRVATARRVTVAHRKAARRACGPGVPL
jgi:hypothetical protein